MNQQEGCNGLRRPLPLREALSEEPDRFPNVRIVRDYAMLRQIGHIRHHHYVARQGKPYGSIVLDRACLIESGDFTSVNIYARDRQGITCAMRVGEVVADENPRKQLFEQLAARLDISSELALTCARFVRAPHHSGRHAVDLIRFVRWQTVRAGWRYCVMQTTERLVPFFRKFDFAETGAWSEDSAGGRLQVLILDTKFQPIQARERHND